MLNLERSDSVGVTLAVAESVGPNEDDKRPRRRPRGLSRTLHYGSFDATMPASRMETAALDPRRRLGCRELGQSLLTPSPAWARVWLRQPAIDG